MKLEAQLIEDFDTGKKQFLFLKFGQIDLIGLKGQ